MAKNSHQRKRISGIGSVGPASEVRHVPIDITEVSKFPSEKIHSNNFVLDYQGRSWKVEESKLTIHKFIIYSGRPSITSGPHGVTIIITDELKSHFEKFRFNVKDINLPISTNTVKRIRRSLNHHRVRDAKSWWESKFESLSRNTPVDFAKINNVHPETARNKRSLMIGKCKRTDGWWKKENVISVLLSEKNIDEIAKNLELDRGYAMSLRTRARKYAKSMFNK